MSGVSGSPDAPSGSPRPTTFKSSATMHRELALAGARSPDATVRRESGVSPERGAPTVASPAGETRVSPPQQQPSDTQDRIRLTPKSKLTAAQAATVLAHAAAAAAAAKLPLDGLSVTASDNNLRKRVGLADDTEFPTFFTRNLIAALLRRIVTAYAEPTRYRALARACDALVDDTPGTKAVSVVLKHRTFMSALTQLQAPSAVWFIENGGYEILLLLSQAATSSDPKTEVLHAEFIDLVIGQPETLETVWAIMRSTFARVAEGDVLSRIFFARDVEQLALHAGLQPETLLELATEHPAMRTDCATVLFKLHEAHWRQRTQPSAETWEILTTLLRLLIWSAGCHDDEIDTEVVSFRAAAEIIRQHLACEPCPAAYCGTLEEFTIYSMGAAALKFVNKSWVVELLEAVLGQADALSARVENAMLRDELLPTFVAHLPKKPGDGDVLNMMELLLVPYLTDGTQRGRPRVSKRIVDDAMTILLRSRTSAATTLTLLHICVDLALEPQPVEASWPIVPRVPTPGGFLTAMRESLIKCMEGHQLPACPLIMDRRNIHNALITAVKEEDARGCALFMACGWNPYEVNPLFDEGEYVTQQMGCAFVKAVNTEVWEVVCVFLSRSPKPVNALLSLPGVGKMTALTLLAYAEGLDMMRVLLDRHPVLADHRCQGESMSPMGAAVRGPAACVSLLLAHGADVHEREPNGVPYLFAALTEGHEETVRLLLAQNVPVDPQHDYLFAAYNRKLYPFSQVDIMKLLLAHGANPHESTMTAGTEISILQQALKDVNTPIVQLLLDYGATYARPEIPEAGAFWGYARTPSSTPEKLLEVLIGHNLCDIRSAWVRGGLSYAFYEGPSRMNQAQQLRVMELLMDYAFFDPSELMVTTEVNLARDLFDCGYIEVAQLLVDYGCPPGLPQLRASDNLDDIDFEDLAFHVPLRRVPIAGQRLMINGSVVHYIPWRPILHPFTPRIFREAARAIAHLRMVGDAADDLTAPTGWVNLPLEIFEIVINELYQHVRASITPGPLFEEEDSASGEGSEDNGSGGGGSEYDDYGSVVDGEDEEEESEQDEDEDDRPSDYS